MDEWVHIGHKCSCFHRSELIWEKTELNLCIMVKTFDLEILKYEHENHKFYNFQSINMIIKGHNTGIIKLINNQHQNWLVYCGKQIQNIGWRETNVWAQKSQLFHFCLFKWKLFCLLKLINRFNMQKNLTERQNT